MGVLTRLSDLISDIFGSRDRQMARHEYLFFRDPNEKHEAARVEAGFVPSAPFVERIKKSYRKSIGQSQPNLDPTLWSDIDQRRDDVHRALLANDDSALSMLSDPVSTELFYGMDELCRSFGNRQTTDDIVDRIARLSEALGVRRTWNPESPWGSNRHAPLPRYMNYEDELEAIGRKTGNALVFTPPFKGCRGLATSKGIAEFRALDAIYQAHKIIKNGGGRVLEIGAGMGRTGYYALRFGASSYSIVDLPLTMVGQAIYFGATVGEDAVQLDGENISDAKVKLYSPENFPVGPFDVIINADSLTEMPEADMRRYLSKIARRCKVFISINHEVNDRTVQDIFGEADVRAPYWMRKGYVEETYRYGERIEMKKKRSATPRGHVDNRPSRLLPAR